MYNVNYLKICMETKSIKFINVAYWVSHVAYSLTLSLKFWGIKVYLAIIPHTY